MAAAPASEEVRAYEADGHVVPACRVPEVGHTP